MLTRAYPLQASRRYDNERRAIAREIGPNCQSRVFFFHPFIEWIYYRSLFIGYRSVTRVPTRPYLRDKQVIKRHVRRGTRGDSSFRTPFPSSPSVVHLRPRRRRLSPFRTRSMRFCPRRRHRDLDVSIVFPRREIRDAITGGGVRPRPQNRRHWDLRLQH